MLAPAIGVLHAGRAAQGFGSACGIAVGRAVLRDTSHGPGLAQAMALAMAIFALGPMTAPLIGYGLVAVGSWRAIFIGMGLFAAGLLVWGLVGFRETNARIDAEALRSDRLLAALARVVRHPQSRFFLLVAASAQFGIVSFVANAPRLFKSSFQVEGLPFALLFASTGLGIVVGQISNRQLIARYGVLAATRLAALVLLFVTVCVVGITLLGAMSAVLFTLLMFAFNTGFLTLIANCASLTIDPHPQIAGFASSVFGFFTQITASVLALATLPLFGGAMLPWSLGMLVVMTGVFAAVICYRGTPFAERQAG
jgi:DHA1 family bicyclomycin/chloramphenicol resistance-like MFS transporter